jgi:hypothetical protein
MDKQRIKDLKEMFNQRADEMAYFYGEEATDDHRQAFRVGAMQALDEVSFILDLERIA